MNDILESEHMHRAVGVALLLALYGCAARAPASSTVGGTPDASVLVSTFATADVGLSADATDPFWTAATPVVANRDYLGAPIDGHGTEIRSRWTRTHLYLLYTCPYETLTLKPSPDLIAETPRLWNWDVVEAFIGWDTTRITSYKEFQVSPQGERIDLDIDRADAGAQQGMAWDSGFEVKAHVDPTARVWYGAMKIPFEAIDPRGADKGRTLRIGLYRIAGVEPRTYFAWQPTGQRSFHVPEAFGTLRLQ